MTWGPLELVVLTFPAERMPAGIGAALDRLATSPDVRLVDALVVRTGADGTVSAVELTDLPGLDDPPPGWDAPAEGLISEADMREIAAAVATGEDAVALLVEHRWSADLAERVAGQDGVLVATAPIPAEHAAEATAGRAEQPGVAGTAPEASPRAGPPRTAETTPRPDLRAEPPRTAETTPRPGPRAGPPRTTDNAPRPGPRAEQPGAAEIAAGPGPRPEQPRTADNAAGLDARAGQSRTAGR